MVPEPFVRVPLFPAQTGSFSDLLFPLGVVVLLVVGALFGVVRMAMIQGTGQSDGPSPDELTNCAECGARTPLAGEECEYCGEPLSETAD